MLMCRVDKCQCQPNGSSIQLEEVLYSRKRYQILADDSLYRQIEVLFSGRRFYTTEGGTRYWQMTVAAHSKQSNKSYTQLQVLYSKRRYQNEVSDIGSGQW